MAEPRDLTPREAQLAAELSADVGVEHIADVYAKAALAAAEKAGQTAAFLDEFDSLVADVLDRLPKLEAVLASGLISPDEKASLLDRTLGRQASKLLLNFLKVVGRHGRLDCLRAIHRQARRLYDKQQGRVRVRLTTAQPLGAALSRRLTDTLRQALGGEPVITHVVDPGVIGGAVLRIEDTVYDGSIANQLTNLRQQMIDRSAHEIQSRRDRFSSPAGN